MNKYTHFNSLYVSLSKKIKLIEIRAQKHIRWSLQNPRESVRYMFMLDRLGHFACMSLFCWEEKDIFILFKKINLKKYINMPKDLY